ncbi:hypothetical protein BJF79_43500 [Actinomadura sp. CNU-125]|nr:hypothetical protein BJF79_43500 [Actinomadura sp. CNU-125]
METTPKTSAPIRTAAAVMVIFRFGPEEGEVFLGTMLLLEREVMRDRGRCARPAGPGGGTGR